jgi:hypothetical protein
MYTSHDFSYFALFKQREKIDGRKKESNKQTKMTAYASAVCNIYLTMQICEFACSRNHG